MQTSSPQFSLLLIKPRVQIQTGRTASFTAVCISGHQYGTDHNCPQCEYEWRITQIPVGLSERPALLHAAYNLRSLPLMTDITKHVRRLMLKDSLTGLGGGTLAQNGGYKHRLSLFLVHTSTLQMSISERLLVLLQLLL